MALNRLGVEFAEARACRADLQSTPGVATHGRRRNSATLAKSLRRSTDGQ
jgi:hypothetical protein